MTIADYIRDMAGKLRDMSDEELADDLFKFYGRAAAIGLLETEDEEIMTKEEWLAWLRLPADLEGEP